MSGQDTKPLISQKPSVAVKPISTPKPSVTPPTPKPTPQPIPPPIPKSATPDPTPQPLAPQPLTPQPPAPQPSVPQPPEPAPVATPMPSSPAVTQPPLLSAQQQADIEEIHRIATSGRVTAADQQAANTIYGRFRLDTATLQELQETARSVARELLTPANAEFAKAARDWKSYGPEQRQEVLATFVDVLNDKLGLDVETRFFNTPPIDGKITDGFYRARNNSINLNTNPASIDSFALAMKTIFHEMTHAQYFDKTKGLTPESAIAKVKEGEIGFTTAMVYFNALPGMYLTTPQVSRLEYMLNPHEQLAFTGQYFWEREAADRGVTDSSPTFAATNPLFAHLRTNRLA